ncbi:MAG: DNA-binding domain-containing protein [Pseudomonadota bacterium]|nr:DNA-binding domain-containing protein [Pseudomonadota bacterium]
MSTPTPQQHFAAALLEPSPGVVPGIRCGGAPEPTDRFAVHRNNIVAGLVDALADTFPVTRALVGDEFFRAMARERVFAEPPRSPVLIDYGDGFPAFIARFAPARGVHFLADVAMLEALRVRAWHAADAPPLEVDHFGDLLADPERLAAARLVLHPACRWFRSRHAAYSIWQAHQGLDDPGEADLHGIDTAQAQDVLIFRPLLQVGVAQLPPGGLEFLDALRSGLRLDAAFLAAHQSAADLDTSALFALLIRHGLAVAVDSRPES